MTTYQSFTSQTSAHPDSALRALLERPSILERALELRSAVCAATPSYAPGVADDMAALARVERSVSAAGLRFADGTEFGEFAGTDGAFADARDLAAALYGADGARLLVGGSTEGNQLVARILAARGATTLVAANAHHSAIYGLIDGNVPLVRLAMEHDGLFDAVHAPTADGVAAALRETPAIDAVHITSPTYEGEVADVRAIADVCHAHGALLVVDFAWGAHLPFHPSLPAPPPELGADVAITSCHKLGGAPQQTALLLYRRDRISEQEIDAACARQVTTSPSMVLLGGIDSALREMAARGNEHIDRVLAMADALAARLSTIPGVDVFAAPPGTAQDGTRVTVRCTAYRTSGYAVAQALAERGIVCEKASPQAATFLMAMGLPDEAPQLIAAEMRSILEMATRRRVPPVRARDPFAGLQCSPVMCPGVAQRLSRTRGVNVPAAEAVGRIAGELYEVYPPGIPLVIPGFEITEGAAELLLAAQAEGGTVTGTQPFNGTVRVLDHIVVPSTTD